MTETQLYMRIQSDVWHRIQVNEMKWKWIYNDNILQYKCRQTQTLPPKGHKTLDSTSTHKRLSVGAYTIYHIFHLSPGPITSWFISAKIAETHQDRNVLDLRHDNAYENETPSCAGRWCSQCHQLITRFPTMWWLDSVYAKMTDPTHDGMHAKKGKQHAKHR